MATLFEKTKLPTVIVILALLLTRLPLAGAGNMLDDNMKASSFGVPNRPKPPMPNAGPFSMGGDNGNGSQTQACDLDTCQVGRQFCWHRQDGEDGRQCDSCDLLQRGCDARGDWGSLTDCLVFKCVESKLHELPKKEAEITMLHDKIRDLLIACCVLATVILIMGVFLAIFVWKLWQLRDKQEDNQSLLTKEDSQTSLTSIGIDTNPVNANNQGQQPGQITGNTTTITNAHEQGEPLLPPTSNIGNASDCRSSSGEESRAMCSGFKQIPPTTDEDTSTQLVTNFTAMAGTP